MLIYLFLLSVKAAGKKDCRLTLGKVKVRNEFFVKVCKVFAESHLSVEVVTEYEAALHSITAIS